MALGTGSNNATPNKKKYHTILLLLLCLFILGCSKAAKDKLLRTFFDGVPALKEEKPMLTYRKTKENTGVKQEATSTVQTPSQFFHQPFLDNQCDSCHESKFSQRLTSQGRELCFTCHDDFTKNKKFVHYPVDDSACGECHDPHQSQHQHLLKKPLLEICFGCHEEKEIKTNTIHEGANSCTDCHNVHASDGKKLLK